MEGLQSLSHHRQRIALLNLPIFTHFYSTSAFYPPPPLSSPTHFTTAILSTADLYLAAIAPSTYRPRTPKRATFVYVRVLAVSYTKQRRLSVSNVAVSAASLACFGRFFGMRDTERRSLVLFIPLLASLSVYFDTWRACVV